MSSQATCRFAHDRLIKFLPHKLCMSIKSKGCKSIKVSTTRQQDSFVDERFRSADLIFFS